jgi:hypothetical protein
LRISARSETIVVRRATEHEEQPQTDSGRSPEATMIWHAFTGGLFVAIIAGPVTASIIAPLIGLCVNLFVDGTGFRFGDFLAYTLPVFVVASIVGSYIGAIAGGACRAPKEGVSLIIGIVAVIAGIVIGMLIAKHNWKPAPGYIAGLKLGGPGPSPFPPIIGGLLGGAAVFVYGLLNSRKPG